MMPPVAFDMISKHSVIWPFSDFPTTVSMAMAIIINIYIELIYIIGFPHSSVSKSSACNAGDPGSIPGSGRSPREGNGHPLQYSCPKNPMDRGAWWATVHGVARVGHNLATKPPPDYKPSTITQRKFPLLFLIYRWRNWDIENLDDLSASCKLYVVEPGFQFGKSGSRAHTLNN